MGIKAITIEVGDPQRIQRGMVRSAGLGLVEILEHLGMTHDHSEPDTADTVECSRSYWMHTDRGGVLSVRAKLAERVIRGQTVAELRNVWGDLVREFDAPDTGVVIGLSTNPTARAGSRILHLGLPVDGGDGSR
jgi:predicted deacylase